MKQLIQAPSYQENAQIYGVATVPENYRKDSAVVFVPGFERFGGEQKWRMLGKNLAKKLMISLQFDFTGLGISEGKYDQPTVENLLADLSQMVSQLQKTFGIEKVSLVSHSMGACVAVAAQNNLPDQIDKIVLLAPALNQPELNRYWFTMNLNKDKEITRENYKDFFDETVYQQSIAIPQVKKANTILPEYMQKMSSHNFESDIHHDQKILVIHGTKDIIVPLKSISYPFSHLTLVDGGDHDIEKPGIIEQRSQKAADFLS